MENYPTPTSRSYLPLHDDEDPVEATARALMYESRLLQAPDSSSSESTSSLRRLSVSGTTLAGDKPQHPSRPPNAWILFRSARCREIKDHSSRKLTQGQLSKLFSQEWRAASLEVKEAYEQLADVKRAEYMILYPHIPGRRARANKLLRMAASNTRLPSNALGLHLPAPTRSSSVTITREREPFPVEYPSAPSVQGTHTSSRGSRAASVSPWQLQHQQFLPDDFAPIPAPVDLWNSPYEHPVGMPASMSDVSESAGKFSGSFLPPNGVPMHESYQYNQLYSSNGWTPECAMQNDARQQQPPIRGSRVVAPHYAPYYYPQELQPTPPYALTPHRALYSTPSYPGALPQPIGPVPTHYSQPYAPSDRHGSVRQYT